MNSVEVAVTHQVRIGREQAWVKVGVNLEYDPMLDKVEMMINEAERIVNQKVISVIEKTVETVENYERKK